MPEPIVPNSAAPQGGNEPMAPITARDVRRENESTAKPPTTPEKPAGTEPVAPSEPTGNKPEAKPEDVDYKTKFSESSTEAQRLHKLLMDSGIDPKTGQKVETPAPKPTEPAAPTTRAPEPAPEQPTPALTDKQLASAIPGFENLTEEEKNVIRNVKGTASKLASMEKLVAEINDERMYQKDFKKLVGNEKWKGLSEFSDEFKEFAYQEANLQTPLETLAASFLYSKGKNANPEALPPAPAGVEPGTNGTRGGAPLSPDEGMSDEEAKALRESNPREYMKLARKGKLKIRES